MELANGISLRRTLPKIGIACVLLLLAFEGCGRRVERVVTIRVVSHSIPAPSSVYIAGSIAQLGNWKPGAVALERRDRSSWERKFIIGEGARVEFRFTRGPWQTQEMDPRGVQYTSNHSFVVSGDTTIVVEVPHWMDLEGGITFIAPRDSIWNLGLWIVNGWRYKAGDDTSWSGVDIDDHNWEIVNSRMYPDDLPPDGWNGIGWFRLHLDVDSSLWNYPLSFRLWQTGASEVYLDGKPLYTFGRIGHSSEHEIAFEDRSPRVLSFSPQTGHVLAVRYSNFSTDNFTRVGIYAGFEILLGDLNATVAGRISAVRQTSVLQMVFTTIPLVLALLHFFPFLFYPKSRENLYYALCMIGFAGITFSVNQSALTTSGHQIITLNSVGIVSQMLAVVTGLLFYYSLSVMKIPLRGIIAVGMGIGLSVWALLLPDRTMNTGKDIFTVLVLLEVLMGFFMPQRRDIKRSPILGVGFLILAVTVVYELLVGYRVLPSIGIQGLYMYGALGLGISMSIFLSRRFAHTNRQLEVQLQQVRDLSARALEQERQARDAEIERRVLAVDNERKTKELDDTRQFQLSLLPKEVPQLAGLEIAAYSAPATEVGGDYYDFATTDSKALTVVLGDATGHGAKAGTMVAVTKGLFHELAHLSDVNEILTRCNRAIKGMNLGQVYMGMTLVRFDGDVMTATIAGMPPVLVYRSQERDVEEIKLKGMPLGAFSDFPFQQKTVQLHEGDAVVLMSDGYAERFNQEGEIMDYPHATKTLRENGEKSTQEILDALLNKGEAWANGRGQNDDITFVIIKKLKDDIRSA